MKCKVLSEAETWAVWNGNGAVWNGNRTVWNGLELLGMGAVWNRKGCMEFNRAVWNGNRTVWNGVHLFRMKYRAVGNTAGIELCRIGKVLPIICLMRQCSTH